MINQPIRILHVFARMDMGGAETMIMNIYRCIDRKKIQFDFIVHTTDKCAYDDEILSLGGKIYSIPKYVGKNHFKYKKTWENFFENHSEYKIMHGHVRSTASIYLKIAKKFKLITIIHSHSTSSGKGINGSIKSLFQYPIRYIGDYFFACSINAGKWLFGEKICKGNRFYVIKNAINVEKFKFNDNIRDEIRKEFKIKEGQFVVGHVGRFHESKNHAFLIDVFNDLLKEIPNSLLLLVGDGDLKNSIENKVKKLGIAKNVIFTGIRSDVYKLFQAMDIFVFPSLYEGFGIVLIEAQASSLPCVVSSAIPDEVLVTNLISRISLQKNKSYWVNSIIKCFTEKSCTRHDIDKKNLMNEYDLNIEANNIIEKYLSYMDI